MDFFQILKQEIFVNLLLALFALVHVLPLPEHLSAKVSVKGRLYVVWNLKKKYINPFLPDCKTAFCRIFLHFSMLFFNL